MQWAKARASADVAMRAEPPVTSTASTKLSQIQGELRQDLEQMVQRQVQAAASHPPPGLSAEEQRLQQLEVGVTELQQQGRKFEHWFQSVGSQVQDQAQAITALQSTVQEQQKELGLFRTEVQTTVTQAVGSVQTPVVVPTPRPDGADPGPFLREEDAPLTRARRALVFWERAGFPSRLYHASVPLCLFLPVLQLGSWLAFASLPELRLIH